MLNIKGVRLYYQVKGKGIPLVFIHPPVLTSVNFYYQMKELSHRFQVITFDIRGHGKSAYSSEPVTYPLIADDVRCILDHLRVKRAFICGYSTGGSIALEFLLAHPDRAFGAVVMSGMSEMTDLYIKSQIRLAIALAKANAVPLLASAVSKTNSDTLRLFMNMLRSAKRGDARNMEQYYTYILRYNCTSRLGMIHHPVLLVYGGEDKRFHPYAKLLHEKLPHSELKWIRGVTHHIPTKAETDLHQLIQRFVNNSMKPEAFI